MGEGEEEEEEEREREREGGRGRERERISMSERDALPVYEKYRRRGFTPDKEGFLKRLGVESSLSSKKPRVWV